MANNISTINSKIKQKRNIFITGGGGVGKSYLLNKLRQKYDMVVTSTTGVSALNVNGQTIHSWSGIGIGQKSLEQIVSQINRNKRKLVQIQSTDILAIDEISMMDNKTLDLINSVLKEVRGNNSPFGGIQVILIGDFFQLPPVQLGNICNNTVIDFAFNSSTWKELDLYNVYLKHVYRQNDTQLISALNNIRQGLTDESDIFYCRNNIVPPETAIRLYSTNKEVDSYNLYKYNCVKEQEYVYTSIDRINCFIDKHFVWLSPYDCKVPEYDRVLYDTFNINCRAPQVLTLKKNCRVMLLKNIDVSRGLVNGACGYVEKLTKNTVTVKFDCGVTHCFSGENFEMFQNGYSKITRLQIPLMLAWACSIHKSQGCTFDNVFIDFSRIFAFGQAYVALSRVRNMQGLFLNNFNPCKIKANPTVIDFYNNLK